ncbi:polyisoprenoid-binding protein [Chitinophaga agrisoli]|uniref:Polyisoprenoid-binding protein n=1 Tax=Chitinophaga agrisoli TaxID=2607653 RepID=A0A5B2VTB7_9BACT|nr:YceI family protein [Chitinophaga agrisoli]KAA2241477.1 polyisoprenoid-binding protein [Chitinophaga agrisoli]
MKKTALLFAVCTILSVAGFAQSTWTADPNHSKLGFTVTHMMISDVDGIFSSFKSTITSAKDDFSDAVVELTADANSVNTDNEKRDAHLKSEDFFDAAKFSTLTFKSKSFKKVGEKKYKVTGDLTLHGVTKTVTLDATLRGITENPMSKKPTAGFKVTGTIKRSDFAFGSKFPSGMLSDEVTITANTEFVKG